MHPLRRHVTALLALFPFTLAARAAQTKDAPMPPPDAHPAKSSTQAYLDIGGDLQRAMQIHYSGNADLDFAMLLQRYDAAIAALSRVELAHGHDAALRDIAQNALKLHEEGQATLADWIDHHR